MKIALVHDWLTGMRGGEKCLEALCEIYPEADLFTLVHVPGSTSPTIENRQIVTSALQKIPGIKRWYRFFLPLMPTAIEALDLSAYDLVISSSHCVAKGALTRPEALHISYMHTPMRYVWDQWPAYFGSGNSAYRLFVAPLLNYMRTWDVASSARVDRYVANSSFVARRIRKYYRRRSTVIHPPVDTDFFDIDGPHGDYYLMVAAMVPYKGVDLAIEAFNAMQKPLMIVGDGHMRRKLMARAGRTIEFTGRISDEELRKCYAGCRAVVLPGAEDFGIVPLEAQACGRPVIALGRAGVLDTVHPLNRRPSFLSGGPRPGGTAPTGVFFYAYRSEALQSAVQYFEENEHVFEPEKLREHARRFNREIFKDKMRQLVDATIAAREEGSWHLDDRADLGKRRFGA